MPPITPTRALIVLTTFLFICLLWTGGFPHEYTPPALPSVNSDAPNEKPVAAPVLPEPLVDNAGVKAGTPVLDKQNAQSSAPKDVGPELDCKHVRGADQIMIIVRTSKAETSDTLPPHLTSLLSCTPHVLIFSDHKGSTSGFPVHDVLSDITATTQASHDEFRVYANLSDPAYKPTPEKTAPLDKWKLLPTLYKTSTTAPSHRFYLFIDPHTTLSWTNLLQWTARLDYRIPYYIGAPHPVATRKYAQTAPAILMSYGTLQLYRSTHEERYAAEWEAHVGTACCGDVVLARAMKDARVQYSAAGGLFEAEGVEEVEWTEKRWCTPVVAWGVGGGGGVLKEGFWAKQEEWRKKVGWDKPYMHMDAFEDFVRGGMEEVKEEWDNVSSDTRIESLGEKRDDAGEDVTQSAPTSPSACQSACQANDECIQWKHREGECHIGKTLRLGAKATAGKKWTSGWMLERVTKRVEDWGRCEKASWQFNQ